MNDFDVFIEGEVIDLCVPSSAPDVISDWYRWFNDPKVNIYIDHGIFPNTFEKQQKFCQSLMEKEDRIALLIKPKKQDFYVGVASLSFINYKQRQCDFAMVIGKQDTSADSIYYAMETKCLMTEHAFEKVGVERVNSGQVVDLIKWQRWQILFGYQIEGIKRKAFRKGNSSWDVMVASCLLEDYLKLKDMRNGKLWPGKKIVFEWLKNLSKQSTIDRLVDWLEEEQEKNWDELSKLNLE